jgi:hypothetical protein
LTLSNLPNVDIEVFVQPAEGLVQSAAVTSPPPHAPRILLLYGSVRNALQPPGCWGSRPFAAVPLAAGETNFGPKRSASPDVDVRPTHTWAVQEGA